MKYPVSRKENPIYLSWKILWAFCFCTGAFSVVVAFFSLNTGFTGMTPPAIYLLFMIAAAVVVPVYTAPSYCAYRKAMPQAKKLLLINLFFGWTVAAYIICAVKVDKFKLPD